ncbi:MAG TPA: hypothetical protein PK370_01750 [Candidatus Woesebacteria bacterium]|nr:hypothetical protein [Candidatus Woesebacteria bacterium]
MKLFPKRDDGGELILLMITWGILSLFGTRFFLMMTGYPQLGNGNWHIAHALWGGAFMVAGLICLLGFNGENARRSGSVLGGIGLGLFLDELGKYLTADNNYWFRPAVVFIYLIFIGLFFIYLRIKKFNDNDPTNLLFAIWERYEKALDESLEPSDLKKIKLSLKKLTNKNLSVNQKLIVNLFEKVKLKEDRIERYSFFENLEKGWRLSYDKIFKRKLVRIIMWMYCGFWSIDKIADAIRIGLSSEKLEMLLKFYDYQFFGGADFYMIGLKIVFEMLTAILLILGIYWWLIIKKKRGLNFMVWGLYANIILAAPFKFYFEQFSAVVQIILTLLMVEIVKEYRKT